MMHCRPWISFSFFLFLAVEAVCRQKLSSLLIPTSHSKQYVTGSLWIKRSVCSGLLWKQNASFRSQKHNNSHFQGDYTLTGTQLYIYSLHFLPPNSLESYTFYLEISDLGHRNEHMLMCGY